MATDHNGQQLTITSEKLMRESFQVLHHMQRDRKLCDVILTARGIEIPAHKCVLASCSQYFYSMFVNSACKTEERIKMDVNPEVLRLVIEYMYTSQLTISKQALKDALEIAKLLMLNNVQIECCNFLRRIININNSLFVKALATTYGSLELLTEISSFIESNFADIATSDEFLNLANEEVKELICKDSLKIPYEEKIYECVTRWIKYDLKGRRKYVRSLMDCVRFRFISKKYLREHIVNDPLVAGDIYCKDLVIKALLDNEKGSSLELKPRKYATESQVMLVIGGGTKESQNTLEFYDFSRGFWSELLKVPFNVQDAKLEVANQKLYLIGGSRDNKPVQTVSSYNLISNSWYDIPDMMKKRTGHGVTNLNNCIYVFGGFDGESVLNSGEHFYHEDKKWVSIAQMSKKRWRFGTCAFNDIAYVVGGYDGTFVLNSVESYNHQQNEWSQLCSMKECRTGLGLCTVDGIIYAIGGWNQDGGVLRTAEKYNPETNMWTEITPMNHARTYVDVAIKDNHIYVVGGSDLHTSTVMDSIEVYSVKDNTWTMLSKSMNVPRSFHCVAMVDLINMHLKF